MDYKLRGRRGEGIHSRNPSTRTLPPFYRWTRTADRDRPLSQPLLAMSAPPSLPPVVLGVKDTYSGGVDILVVKGLKKAHDFFTQVDRTPPMALDCDDLGGISVGYERRQGRAMELAPLMEVRRAPPPPPLPPMPSIIPPVKG